MISINLILLLVLLHWIADFVLQSDDMANNKSKSNKWLGIHCLVYIIPFLLIGWKFAILNGIIHFGIDWCTSRVNSKLWEKKEIHWFFVDIGFDQAIHISTLVLTYIWLV